MEPPREHAAREGDEDCVPARAPGLPEQLDGVGDAHGRGVRGRLQRRERRGFVVLPLPLARRAAGLRRAEAVGRARQGRRVGDVADDQRDERPVEPVQRAARPAPALRQVRLVGRPRGPPGAHGLGDGVAGAEPDVGLARERRVDVVAGPGLGVAVDPRADVRREIPRGQRRADDVRRRAAERDDGLRQNGLRAAVAGGGREPEAQGAHVRVRARVVDDAADAEPRVAAQARERVVLLAAGVADELARGVDRGRARRAAAVAAPAGPAERRGAPRARVLALDVRDLAPVAAPVAAVAAPRVARQGPQRVVGPAAVVAEVLAVRGLRRRARRAAAVAAAARPAERRRAARARVLAAGLQGRALAPVAAPGARVAEAPVAAERADGVEERGAVRAAVLARRRVLERRAVGAAAVAAAAGPAERRGPPRARVLALDVRRLAPVAAPRPAVAAPAVARERPQRVVGPPAVVAQVLALGVALRRARRAAAVAAAARPAERRRAARARVLAAGLQGRALAPGAAPLAAVAEAPVAAERAGRVEEGRAGVALELAGHGVAHRRRAGRLAAPRLRRLRRRRRRRRRGDGRRRREQRVRRHGHAARLGDDGARLRDEQRDAAAEVRRLDV